MGETNLPIALLSTLTYFVYHSYEPTQPAVHLTLLLISPLLVVSQSSSSNFFATYVLACLQHWLLIVLLVVAYRLSPIHPLASYPGPLPAKISKFWAFHITAAQGDMHEVTRKLHDQYGDVIRIGPNELSFAREDAIQPILAAKALPKGPYYETRRQGHFIALDGIRDFRVHDARRKAWARAMSPNALKEYETDLKALITELVDQLEARARNGEDINISSWMSFLGVDAIGKIAFNHDFGMLKAGKDVDGFVHTLESGIVGCALLSHVPWVLPMVNLIPGGGKEFLIMQEMGLKMARARVEKGSRFKDLFFYLSGEDAVDQDAKPPLDLVLADGMLAILAGSDTTASALSHLWYFLLKHPRCFALLRKEILDQEVDNFSGQVDMPYMNACLNEAMRLYPPALGALQRQVVDKGGRRVAEHFVPEGTSVSVSFYSLCRSPAHFYPLPNEFWPERWLTSASVPDCTLPSGSTISASKMITDKDVFMPFSTGTQNCAGRVLANAEMRVTVSTMLRRFESMIVPPSGKTSFEEWEQKIQEVYIQVRGPLLVKLKLAETS